MSVSAIILAAGRSSRFEGGHKLLVPVKGLPMVRRVARAVAASQASDIFLVVEPGERPIAQAAGKGRWTIVENPDASSGLASSVRAGIKALPAGASGAAVFLADMPFVSTALIDLLIDEFEVARGTSIVFPVAPDGRRGHPVIWPRQFFPDLMSLTGDVGGKALLDNHENLCRPVTVNDVSVFADIDTRADLP